VRKAPLKKLKAVVPKAKKAAPTVPKLQKPPSKKAPAKKPVKEGVAQVVLVQKVKGEVMTQNSRGRQIKLLTRFK
jgi:hypothetical protein